MRTILSAITLWLLSTNASACPELLDHVVRTLDGDETVRLCDEYRDKVVLVVNTASRCAYTDQYDSLENLYHRYRNRGLVVLGFPSNDFGNQEPGTEKQIKKFCRLTYGVKFPMFGKTRVTKHAADPLFEDLAAASGNYPGWNFHKYLIGRDGELIADFASAYEPLSPPILPAIEAALAR